MSDRDESVSEEQAGTGGLAAAARAVGKAFGFLRFRRADREPVARPGRLRAASAPAARTGPAPTEAVSIQAEIRRLEAELDGIYATLGQREGGPAPRAAELTSLIERTRLLREQLLAKRRRLDKLERDAARERLLRPAPPPAASPGAPPLAAAKPAGRGRRPAAKAVVARPLRAARRQPDSGCPADEATRLLLEKLEQNLSDPEVEVRRAATSRLAEIDAGAARDLLARAADDADERVQAAALNALAHQPTAAAAALFRRYAFDSNPHLRLAALRGLARLDDPDANLWLIEALEDEHTLTRHAAATLLGWREVRAAVGPLILALHDPDAGVRTAAASALGTLGEDRAVLPLIRLLLDESATVREAALASLRTLAGDDIDIAHDPNRFTEDEVSVLKRWWRQGRLERRLRPVEGLPEETIAGAPSAPAAAAAARVVDQPARQPATAPAEERRTKTDLGKAGSGSVEARPPVATVAAAPPPVRKPTPLPEPEVQPEPAASPGKEELAGEAEGAGPTGLDDLLGAEFQEAGVAVEMEAEPGAAREGAGSEGEDASEGEGGEFESPLDGFLSDLGARPARPKED